MAIFLNKLRSVLITLHEDNYFIAMRVFKYICFNVMSFQNSSKHIPFYFFTLAVVLALVLPSLLQHGMFMDGIQYAVVSKNLSEGIGTFWFPFLSSSWEKQGQNYFLEHPQLVYGLQSLFFKLFNGGFYSERMYCLATVFICMLLIAAIWRLIFKDHKRYRSFFWLPVLLWIITPSVFWSFINNMHENTMSVFVLSAVYFSLRGITLSSWKLANILLAALSVFLATFSKGLPGLFSVIIALVFYVVFKRISFKTTVLYSFILVFFPVLIYGCLVLLNEQALQSLSFYVKERLFVRIDEGGQVNNRLATLFWLFTDLLAPLGLLALIFLLFKIKRIEGTLRAPCDDELKRWMIFFVLIGMAGVLPLCLTQVQRAVYFVPALPFFAVALALLCLKGLDLLFEKSTKERWYLQLKYISIAAFVIVVSYSFFNKGKTYRDEVVLEQVHHLANEVGSGTVIGAPYYIYDEWDLQFYLLRYHNITLDPYVEKSFPFKMFEKEKVYDDTLYTLMPFELEKYKVYKRNN
jgi:hypothetical protein